MNSLKTSITSDGCNDEITTKFHTTDANFQSTFISCLCRVLLITKFRNNNTENLRLKLLLYFAY